MKKIMKTDVKRKKFYLPKSPIYKGIEYLGNEIFFKIQMNLRRRELQTTQTLVTAVVQPFFGHNF